MSLQRVLENMDYWSSRNKKDPEKALGVVRRGLEMRPERKDGATFWDDFINILGGNTEEIASLLDVSSSSVASWSSKIKKALSQVEKEGEDQETHIVNTGT